MNFVGPMISTGPTIQQAILRDTDSDICGVRSDYVSGVRLSSAMTFGTSELGAKLPPLKL